MQISKYCESVGVGVAIVSSDGSKENAFPVVSLIFPKQTPVHPEDPYHDDNFFDVFIPMSAAKSLLVDLRNAVESSVSGDLLDQ